MNDGSRGSPMDFTMDQILTIVGRLDDAAGFDTPRERFRRFLREQMTSVDSARTFIEQCRAQSGEQSHRALQDAIVLAGRLLGFDPSFGSYQHDPGLMPQHGSWQSRHRQHVTLILCSDQTIDIDLDTVSRAIAGSEGPPSRIGLLVITPFYSGKHRLEQGVHSGKYPMLRLISVRGILRLAEMVADRTLTHDDVLQILDPSATLDARLDLLDRVMVAGQAEPDGEVAGPVAVKPDHHERRCWVNAMRVDPFTPTERIVRSLIGARQILGINPSPGLEDRVRAGDAICVFIAGRGIVAHGQINAILADGSRMLRDAKRFTHVLRLTNVTVYDAPVIPTLELTRKLDLALLDETEAVTVPISPREFDLITAHALSEAG
jgi:hypothetical protein